MTFPTWLALADTFAHVATLSWLGVSLWRLKQERHEHGHLMSVADDTHQALRTRNNWLREELTKTRREVARLTAERARAG